MDFINIIERFKNSYDIEYLKNSLDTLFPIDIALGLNELEVEDIILVCQNLTDEKICDIIKEAPTDVQVKLINLLDLKRILNVFINLPDDDVVDILGELPFSKRKHLLKVMKDSRSEYLEKLLSYPTDSAGGIMTTEYIALKSHNTVYTAIKKIKEIAPKTEVIETLFIINNSNQLIGTVDLRDILVSEGDVILEQIMDTHVISVYPETDQEEVSLIVSKYNINAIPVINKKQSLIGIITIDDIIDVIQEEYTEDILKMAGVDKDETIDSSVLFSIKKRLPWLCVNLCTAILASSVVGIFEDTISEIVALAVIMPIIAGMGGNAGNQTLSIVIRGIALNEISIKEDWKQAFKEVAIGGINGLLVGLLTSLLVFIFSGNIYLALIVLISMTINLTIAALFGFLIPIVLKHFKLDPALASSIFLTTITDVLGFFVFLSLATIFKNVLI